MIPVDWFMALETEDGRGLFSDTANLKRYGFIAAKQDDSLNPYGLPVGFAVDPHPIPGRGPSLGLTCAACHTADVTVNGRIIRIGGAPANPDFDTFNSDLAAVVDRTYSDAEAFERFAARVLSDLPPPAVSELRLQFAEFHSALAGDTIIRTPKRFSGFGRVDALT